MTTVQKRRYALLAGLGGAFVLFLIIRGRGGTPAEELLAAEGGYPATSLDAGTTPTDTSFVSMLEDRLAQQDVLLEEALAGQAGKIENISSAVEDLGQFIEDFAAAQVPLELPPEGPIDPYAPGGSASLYPRVTRGGVEVEPGVFQPVSWFFRAFEPFASIFAALRSAGIPESGGAPDPYRSTREGSNDPGASGQAPPPSPGNRRATLGAFSRIRMPVFRTPTFRTPTFRSPVYRTSAYRSPVYTTSAYRSPVYRTSAYRTSAVALQAASFSRGGSANARTIPMALRKAE